jgi:hypothetical protein
MLQEVQYKSHPARKAMGIRPVYPMTFTVSGTEGSRIVNSSSATFIILSDIVAPGMGTTIAQEYQIAYTSCTSWASDNEYEPEMVARLLRLDTEAPEAKFNNVVDMMDWLDRD